MKRSALRLVVLGLAVVVLFTGPIAEPTRAQADCSFVNLYCNNNDWCDHWWMILFGYPYTFYQVEFCCTWDGTNLDCWFRHGPLPNGACCSGGMWDTEEGEGDGESPA